MENTEKPCRHEYIKIFQRRFKDKDRRLTSTRGYLPTGFSNKDFNYLGSGTSCFCTACRMRLFPVRTDATRAAARLQLQNAAANQALAAEIVNPDQNDNLWADDNAPINIESSQVVAVDELQIETADVSDIVEKELNATKEECIEEEVGDE